MMRRFWTCPAGLAGAAVGVVGARTWIVLFASRTVCVGGALGAMVRTAASGEFVTPAVVMVTLGRTVIVVEGN